MISKIPPDTRKPCEGLHCVCYAMTQRDYRKLRGETWDSSTFGKAAKKLYRTLYGKEPPNEPSAAKKRDPVPVYPCGVLEETYHSLRQGSPCAFYELTQNEFRQRRGEKWSPSYISRFGKLATKLYRTLYKKEPPQDASTEDLHDLVNVYPRGVLEQAYARLKADGAEIGEPYIEPDPSLRPPKPEKKYEYPLPSDPKQRARVSRIRESLTHGQTSAGIIMKRPAKRTADIAAGKDRRPEPDPFDWAEPYISGPRASDD